MEDMMQAGPQGRGAPAHPVADIQTCSVDLDALARADAQGPVPVPPRLSSAHTAAPTAATPVQHQPTSPPPPPPPTALSADLLGLGEDAGGDDLAHARMAQQPRPQPTHPPQPQPQPPLQPPVVASVEEVDDFFSGGAAGPVPAAAAATRPAAGSPAAAAATARLYAAPARTPQQQAPRTAARPDSGTEPAVDWAKLEEEDKARARAEATQQQMQQQDAGGSA